MRFKRQITPLPFHRHVLTIGVVVAVLGAPEFVASSQHDRAGRGEQRAQQRAQVGGAAGEHLRIIARPFNAAIPRMVLTVAIAPCLTIRIVVAMGIGDRVSQREPVMRGEEVDAAAVRPEQIG